MEAVLKARSLDRLWLWWERHHPPVVGFCASAAYAWFGADWMAGMVARNWQVGSIYSSVFDTASVFTAFLFTFYTLIVTTDRGFIGRMKNTRAYGLLKQYAISALLVGGSVIAASIPFMVVEPKPVSITEPWHLALTLWVGLVAWTAAAFIRATRLFVEFIRQHD